MAGKVLGNSILAIGVIILIVGLSVVSMLVTGQELLFGEVGMSLLWFAILFLAGFVLLATLYASIAALVSRQEDIGSVTSPLMMLVMIPYFLVIFFNTNATVLAVMSYVPFSAPVGMPMRVYPGHSPVVGADCVARDSGGHDRDRAVARRKNLRKLNSAHRRTRQVW